MKTNLSPDNKVAPPIHHPRFAAFYERLSRTQSERRVMGPLRKEIIDQASGRVLEIGAGTGLNFPFYQPEQVEHVAAVEPDDAMLRYARERLATAHVPIELTQAPQELCVFTGLRNYFVLYSGQKIPRKHHFRG